MLSPVITRQLNLLFTTQKAKMNEEKYSICKLCLEKNSELLNIFSNNIDAILQQFPHFKFEDAFASIAVICTDCWRKVRDFHEFCMKVEKIHEETCRLADQEFQTDLSLLKVLRVEGEVEQPVTRTEAIKVEIDAAIKEYEQFEENDESECVNEGDVTAESSETDEESSKTVSNVQTTGKRSSQRISSQTKAKQQKKQLEKIPITPELKQILKEQLKVMVDYHTDEAVNYRFVKKCMPLKCDMCKEPFSTFDKSQEHFLTKHKRSGYWKCCEIQFETVYDILDHMKYHRDPETFKCRVCHRCFTTTNKLHRHIYRTHFKEVENYECRFCGEAHKGYSKLAAHEKGHINVHCPHCQKSICLSNLHQHIKGSHSGTLRVTCDLCGKVSCDKRAHNQHYLIEHTDIDHRLQCDICKKWMKHKSRMMIHMRKHFRPPVVCNICGKTFANRGALSAHKNRHGEQMHKCRYCEKQFIKLCLVKEHESTHRDNKVYQCDFCDKTFRFNTGLHVHRKRAHSQERHTQVQITPELEQILKEQLKVMVDYHNAEEVNYKFVKRFMPLKCVMCKEPFLTFDESHEHFLTKHKRAGYWKCCKNKFGSVYDVLDHMKYHRDPETFKCKVCHRCFTTTANLHRHIYCIHFKDAENYECRFCGLAFKDYRKFGIHEKRHNNVDCPHCRKSICISALPQHIRFSHSGILKVMCDLCGKVSCDMAAHERHYLVEHTDIDQRLQCDICKKWIKHRKEMIKHMSRHFQTPETCDICGKTVANRYALSGHKQGHRERKNKCRYCGKEYIVIKSLREHESIHLGIKDLYQCNFCDKTFRFNSGMYAHRKRAHPQEYLTLGKKN